MADQTKIQWCDATFNPWRGCTKVSDGCANCYAEAGSKRNPSVLGKWGPQGVRVLGAESYWGLPWTWHKKALRSRKRLKVFCASLADVFEDWGGQLVDTAGNRLWWHPTDQRFEPRVCVNQSGSFLPHKEFEPYMLTHARARLLLEIHVTHNLNWLLLTKRPEHFQRHMEAIMDIDPHDAGDLAAQWVLGSPMPNIWMGTSTENQECLLARLPALLQIPATVRFLSVEPQLGPITLPKGIKGLHWVIVGGESGSHSRPFNPEWARYLRDQCEQEGIAFFLKQFGANPQVEGPPDGDTAQDGRRLHPLKLMDKKGGDMEEWAQDLRVREFPRVQGGVT